MENNNLQNGIDEIKKIKMTSEEKNRILHSVMNSKIPTENKPIQSPWFTYSFMARIRKNNLVFYVVIPLIIILAGGGMAFASEGSLPDSILYPIKVNVVEPIRGALSFSPESKAQFESNLATERLTEAETLAGEGKLDKPTEDRLNNLLQKHTASLNKALVKADKKQTVESVNQTDEIVTNFHANMNAHARVIDILNGVEDKQNDPNTDIQISETARSNADKVRNIAKNKDEKNNNGNNKQDKSDKYKKRKEAIESLINKTTTELSNISNKPGSSDKEIIDDANETLKEARLFLSEADNHEKDGNSEDAYSTLLDSESSVKEAGIFLRTGLKFGEKFKGRGND